MSTKNLRKNPPDTQGYGLQRFVKKKKTL